VEQVSNGARGSVGNLRQADTVVRITRRLIDTANLRAQGFGYGKAGGIVSCARNPKA